MPTYKSRRSGVDLRTVLPPAKATSLDMETVQKQVIIAEAFLRDRLKDGPMTGCTSFVQRKLQCGYNRAATILELLEQGGVITDADATGARRLK